MSQLETRQPQLLTIFRGGAEPDEGDQGNTGSQSGG